MDLRQALQDPVVRKEAMRDNFLLFFAYHFGREFKKFHKDWMRSMQDGHNTMIVAFRASRKTTIARGYVVRSIVYKKHPSVIRQSYEDTLSAESVREIAKMLCTATVVRDYGYLFPFETKKEDLKKSSMSNFESTNGVKVASKSLGQTLRGSNTFDIESGISARPTLLILDDIDVVKSVSNIDIINNNEKKILGETIPALDPLNRQIIFLGNVINDDGIVPRFYEQYKNSRDAYRLPLFVDNENIRPEVFTHEVIQEIVADGKTSYNQNYLLIPATLGNGIFVSEYFDYFLYSHFEQEDSFLKKQDMRIGIFIDPAFSTSSTSDDAVVMAVGEHIISKQYYIFDTYADTSAPSKTLNAVIVMINKLIMDGYKVDFVSVENVTINKQQTDFVQKLREKLTEHQINIPIQLYEPKIKKQDRIKFNLEAIMSQKGIKFNRNMPKLNKIERQFLEFPQGNHDDIIDTVSQAVEVLRKKPGHNTNKKYHTPISAFTRKQITGNSARARR